MVSTALTTETVKGFVTGVTRNYVPHTMFPTLLFLFLPIQVLPLFSSNSKDIIAKHFYYKFIPSIK